MIHADSFRVRWKGLRPRAGGRRMIFRTSSVHGFGMREALWAVGLDANGVVVGVRQLNPGRIVWIGGARWIIELPIEEEPPRPGESVAPRLSVQAGFSRAKPGRTSLTRPASTFSRVDHSDRKPKRRVRRLSDRSRG